MNWKENLGEMMTKIVDSPKIALAVPATTAAIAPISMLAEIQGVFSLVSVIVGTIISFILLRKQWISLKKEELEIEAVIERMKSRNEK